MLTNVQGPSEPVYLAGSDYEPEVDALRKLAARRSPLAASPPGTDALGDRDDPQRGG